MRHLLGCLLLACATSASAQAVLIQDYPDPDLALAWPSWLVGDHAKARTHFQAAAQRGQPLGEYNLAMMLLLGEGGPRQPAQGMIMLCRAAAHGVELAQRELVLRQARAKSMACGL